MAGRYRLLALDLDGTLCGDDLRIARPVRRALEEARRSGVYVTLATGRMFRATLPFARELGLDTTLVCYQGAYLREVRASAPWFHQGLPMQASLEVVDYAHQRGYALNLYLDDELYVRQPSPESQVYATMARVDLQVVGDLRAFLQRRGVADGQGPTKAVIITDEATTPRVVAELSQRFGGALGVVQSYRLFAEVVHPHVSKGDGLARLCYRLGVRPEEVIAVGDNLNDLEMLRFAGLGVAMGNAHPALQAAADDVCPDLDHHGVVDVVRRFLL